MNDLAAKIFVALDDVPRSVLAAELIGRTVAMPVSGTVGTLGVVEFEVRRNPDGREAEEEHLLDVLDALRQWAPPGRAVE